LPPISFSSNSFNANHQNYHNSCFHFSGTLSKSCKITILHFDISLIFENVVIVVFFCVCQEKHTMNFYCWTKIYLIMKNHIWTISHQWSYSPIIQTNQSCFYCRNLLYYIFARKRQPLKDPLFVETCYSFYLLSYNCWYSSRRKCSNSGCF
jgi:hypothetical protein